MGGGGAREGRRERERERHADTHRVGDREELERDRER